MKQRMVFTMEQDDGTLVYRHRYEIEEQEEGDGISYDQAEEAFHDFLKGAGYGVEDEPNEA